jgi:hypothetical protein
MLKSSIFFGAAFQHNSDDGNFLGSLLFGLLFFSVLTILEVTFETNKNISLKDR